MVGLKSSHDSSELKIWIISPDVGGFGGKVPVYPGYVWIEDRMENLQADSFARDYHIDAELGADREGKITNLRIKTLADHGYADAAANPGSSSRPRSASPPRRTSGVDWTSS